MKLGDILYHTQSIYVEGNGIMQLECVKINNITNANGTHTTYTLKVLTKEDIGVLVVVKKVSDGVYKYVDMEHGTDYYDGEGDNPILFEGNKLYYSNLKDLLIEAKQVLIKNMNDKIKEFQIKIENAQKNIDSMASLNIDDIPDIEMNKLSEHYAKIFVHKI